ncbi:MAG: hypothetical protein ABIV21_05345 [Pyrinomonadaceae bacterium]
MKNYLTITLLMIMTGMVSSCSETKGVPVDFANACAVGNDKKVIEVAGFLEPRQFMYCSNRGGRMECGFDLKDAPGSKNIVRVELEEGSSANTAEKMDSGFKKEDVKIHDNTGSIIGPGDKVRVTGKISIVPPFGNAEGVCFMQVTKIEK